MLYASESLSLAALETVVNLSSGKLDLGLMCVELEFPDHLPVETVELELLPPHWNSYPYISETVLIGSDFLKKGGLCFKVPSALIPSEFNYLLNPIHSEFDQISIRDIHPMILDKRLLGE